VKRITGFNYNKAEIRETHIPLIYRLHYKKWKLNRNHGVTLILIIKRKNYDGEFTAFHPFNIRFKRQRINIWSGYSHSYNHSSLFLLINGFLILNHASFLFLYFDHNCLEYSYWRPLFPGSTASISCIPPMPWI